MLVCARCGSRNIVTDKEQLPGVSGWHEYQKCMMCGHRNVKEADVGTYNKKCEAAGCEKKSWLKGLCHKHYMEKYGEYVPVKRGTGVTVPPKKEKVPVPEKAEPVPVPENGQCLPMPVIQVFLDADLLDRLVKAARKDFRHPEQQAAYLISKGLEAAI